ncbi:MauE/DoxX family redox-associated membrane protein [Pararcticibacter amylolyticus]|uniref:Methylamine utilisation protein MauE domain-containing protein n=1 Tax=Pararcticibacter amylolyticus TaxID=2173175 RepID=A0A2U2PHD8_9SPHI|nr:MauE/DoxX family redox-associated membrane protein [Pararcticibacter amylolyticus]PWG80672.1 hypothetical protein DDR33_11675 [Pararcticibacter amylolyticus]
MYHVLINKTNIFNNRIRALFTGKVKDYTVFVICMLCLVLFVISAYDKIADHETFEKGLARVAFIGRYAPLIAWTVPILEAGIAVLLMIPPASRLGLYGFTGLMIVFTLYILSMLLWAEHLPCNCNLLPHKDELGRTFPFQPGLYRVGPVWPEDQ